MSHCTMYWLTMATLAVEHDCQLLSQLQSLEGTYLDQGCTLLQCPLYLRWLSSWQ